jgi:hypothetical protein
MAVSIGNNFFRLSIIFEFVERYRLRNIESAGTCAPQFLQMRTHANHAAISSARVRTYVPAEHTTRMPIADCGSRIAESIGL